MAGPWPLDHPLPLPVWSTKAKPIYRLESVVEYEHLASQIEFQLQKVLEEQNYDSVSNFLRFYEGFKASKGTSVTEFFQR